MPEHYGRIYRVTNKVNGKSYIGQTTLTLAQRWACHLTNPSKAPLGRAIRKYGREAFSLDTLELCADAESLDAAEQRWIEALGTKVPKGYNVRDGGYSVQFDVATRAKMSALLCQRYADPAARQAHAEQMRRIWTPERRAKAAELGKQRCTDPAERERMRTLSRAHWAKDGAREAGSVAAAAGWTPERRKAFAGAVSASWKDPDVRARREASLALTRFRIPVIASKGGEERAFGSSREAARALGLSESAVSMCLRGTQAQAKGYTFRKGAK